MTGSTLPQPLCRTTSADTFGLERYKEAMQATAAVLYPPPLPPPPPSGPVGRPKGLAGRRLPPRAKMVSLRAPQGYMFVGPYLVPIGSTVTIAEIQAKVAKHFRIPQTEMTSQRRSSDVSGPRQVAMYLAKQLTPRSLPDIGRLFGGRDHTTVIHAIRAVEYRRAQNHQLDQDIRTIRARLRGTI